MLIGEGLIGEGLIGEGSISLSNQKTVIGKSRLKTNTTTNTAGLLRIQKNNNFIVAGLASVTNPELNHLQSLNGKARIYRTLTRNQTGQGLIGIFGLQVINGKARIIAPIYTRQAVTLLPDSNNNLAIIYSAQDLIDVATDNGVRVGLSGAGILIHQFQLQAINNTDGINIIWKGQSITSPTFSPVYLQIYNYILAKWENVAVNNTASPNNDFTLEASITANLQNYYDENYSVTARVYQNIGGH